MAIQLTFRSGSGVTLYGDARPVTASQITFREQTVQVKGVRIPGIAQLRFPELRISFATPILGKVIFPNAGGGSITTNDAQLYPRYRLQR